MQVEIPKALKIRGEDETEVIVDVSRLKMNKSQDEAFAKLLHLGDPDKLSENERGVLKGLKAQIKTRDVHPDGFVRFDLRFFSID